MREHLLGVRDRLHATADTVCLERARLVTQAHADHEGEPAPLLRARPFARVLFRDRSVGTEELRRALASDFGGEGGSRGPTALLASVLGIDAPRHYPGGYNLNLTLEPAHASEELLVALVEGFFASGGQELQPSVLDPELLREARRQPERHGTLVVRLAGLSALFVSLSRLEEEEIIARAERACGRSRAT